MTDPSAPLPLNTSNLAFGEAQYAKFHRDPTSVPADWRAWFAELDRPVLTGAAYGADAEPLSEVALEAALAQPAVSGDVTARRAAVLGSFHLFQGLSADDLRPMAAIAGEVRFRAGERLYREGDPGESLYVVTAGALAIWHAGEMLVEVGPGKATGELGLLYGQPRTADVLGAKDGTALRIRRQDLEQLLDDHGPLARRMMQNVAQKLAESNLRQERVDMLIRVFRVRGHVIAQLDPLGHGQASHPELELAHNGLGQADLDLTFSCRTMRGAPVLTLRQIVKRLKTTYCGPIGVQYMHIDDPESKDWLQARMETTENRRNLSRDEQVRIFTKLTDAEVFESFLQKKYVGAKRFSLEGGESLIPLLDLALEAAGAQGIEDVVIGMAHRGRLNVLANIVGKSPQQIFREFDDKAPDQHIGHGDVKYHLGHSGMRALPDGRTMRVHLCFNPSHLEFVGPVVAGRVRAHQDRLGDTARCRALPIVIHGDAAMAGQGVVQELLNMSQLPGYAVGGTVHIVVNNQIGFTTPVEASRSSHYATDVAKMLQVPIFHVNGEHPEGVAQVVELAMDFRARFHRDVVIDMYCYRRHGHNEGDDPTFTQPLMYQAIRARKSVVEGYLDHLLGLGGLTRAEAQDIAQQSQQRLELALSHARAQQPLVETPRPHTPWSHYRGGKDRDVPEVETALAATRLSDLVLRQTRLPGDFTPHPKIQKLLDNRREMAEDRKALDWGTGEALALASIAAEGRHVRLSGQDVGRGTFSHRHAVLHDFADGHIYTPLQHIAPDQGEVEIWDSPLSETGVLGFDFGYSLDCPDSLTIWEAQFGDFCNAAQVIIDQFICSSEDKWQRLSGLVLLLPHGFEGQGPEHSSARMERFLNNAADDNLHVVNLTTPAQLFHCLRRHVRRAIRKPLVVLTPKSLLRHPQAISPLADFAGGAFQRVIPDASIDPQKTKRILLCTGKIYFDLLAARHDKGSDDVAIVRIEQLYPLSDAELQAALSPYCQDVPVCWVQEEPCNMGAWVFLCMRLGRTLFGKWRLHGISRPEAASPATGSAAAHKQEQTRLLDEAFDLEILPAG